MSDDLSGFSLIELFRAEAEAQTGILSEGVLQLERGNVSPEILESLMRAAHSLKGAARIVGLDAAVGVAHVLEDYFVAAQKEQIQIEASHIDVILQGIDLLNQIAQLSDVHSAQWLAENEASIAAYVANFGAMLSNEPTALAARPKDEDNNTQRLPTVSQWSSQEEPELPIQPQPQLSGSSGSVQAVSQPVPVEKVERVVKVAADNMNRLLGLAGESLVESRQFRSLVISLQQIKQTQAAVFESIRALEERLDSGGVTNASVCLDVLSRAKNQALQCQQELSERIHELDDFAHRSENLAGRLHHEILTSRMRPLAEGIRGFPRLVRDISRQLGKNVIYEVRGEQTGVDRDILDKLEAPLNHLLRNALDHGIELPEERTAAGKPASGLIRLEACHRAGMLHIIVRDDGRGIDPGRLRNKVVERGLVPLAMAERLTEPELLDFLFLPGFSTKDGVTEISGRGVGLDVVQTMVKNLGGSVRVTSLVGRETCFTLRLPITRSVIRALLVQIAGEPYAFPLTRIERIEMVGRDRLRWLEGRQFFTLNEQTVGLVDAIQVLDLPRSSERLPELLPVVVISDRGHLFGLIVDHFLGERDLDVRPLDPRLSKVPNLGGASLLEDGQPVLIFDVEDLVRSIDNRLAGRRPVGSLRQPSSESAGSKAVRRVLVVDDSITVRELERQLLESHGYEVDTAVDGMDGWNTVRSGAYQLVVSDVDMPRMDGIELVKRIKQDPRLKGIPVIIVSYKDREEDRMRGLDAGANCYLTKSSFHDQTFITAVIDLIGQART